VSDRLIAVGVPVPGLGRLTYRVPDGEPIPPKGARVNVPLGNRVVMGCVIEPHALVPTAALGAKAGGTVRDVAEILDTEPYLPEHIVDLALWVAEYYAAGPGDALAVALPPMSHKGGATAFRTVKIVEATAGKTAGQADAATPKGAKQQQALALLAHTPTGLPAVALAKAGARDGNLWQYTHGRASSSSAEISQGMAGLAREESCSVHGCVARLCKEALPAPVTDLQRRR
jgi:primosomal protein N' (replication factor Y)